jgi:hypothetical protein
MGENKRCGTIIGYLKISTRASMIGEGHSVTGVLSENVKSRARNEFDVLLI